jgi:hypothetical protein
MPTIYVDPGVLVGSLIKDANTERGMQLLGSAQGLSRGRSRVIGCRGLDILHVANAVEIGARTFWTFDGRQKELARSRNVSQSVSGYPV